MGSVEVTNFLKTLDALPTIDGQKLLFKRDSARRGSVKDEIQTSVEVVTFQGRQCAVKIIPGVNPEAILSNRLTNLRVSADMAPLGKTESGPGSLIIPRLVRSYSTLEKMQHQNVIRILGKCFLCKTTANNFGGEKQQHDLLIVMELCMGSLRDCLASTMEISAAKMYRWFQEILSGIKYLHVTASMYHGNLKPENILLTEELTCRLSDFGFSVDTSIFSLNTNRLPSHNSEPYMAPELQGDLTTRSAQQKADIFAFGTILYDILHRCSNSKSYFPADWNKSQMVDSLVAMNNRPVLDSRIPFTLRALIIACWQECPDDRPSIDQISAVLELAALEIDALEEWIDDLNSAKSAIVELRQSLTVPESLTADASDTELILDLKVEMTKILVAKRPLELAMTAVKSVEFVESITQEYVTPIAEFLPAFWRQYLDVKNYKSLLTQCDADKLLPIHKVAKFGSPPEMTLMLDLMDKLNMSSLLEAKGGKLMQTPLLFAAYNRQHDLIQLLVDRGANPSAIIVVPDKNGTSHANTLIHHAAKYGCLKVFKAAIKLIGSPGCSYGLESEGFQNQTPLFYAICDKECQSTEKIELLLAYGANVNAKNVGGSYILEFAAAVAKESVFEYIAELPTKLFTTWDLKIKNSMNRTILMIATMYGNTAVTKLLIEKYDDQMQYEATDKVEDTALHLACQYDGKFFWGTFDSVALLVEKYPHALMKTNLKGQRPLDCAKARKEDPAMREKMVKFLEVAMKNSKNWSINLY